MVIEMLPLNHLHLPPTLISEEEETEDSEEEEVEGGTGEEEEEENVNGAKDMRVRIAQQMKLILIRQGIPEALMKAWAVYKYDLSLPLHKIYDPVKEMRARLRNYGDYTHLLIKIYYLHPKRSKLSSNKGL